MNKVIEEAIKICGSQQALANGAGISQGSVWKYLSKRCKPKYLTAENLSSAVSGRIPAVAFLMPERYPDGFLSIQKNNAATPPKSTNTAIEHFDSSHKTSSRNDEEVRVNP